MPALKVEYEDRVIRYPDGQTYRLVMRGIGDVVILDGLGGRTICRARWSDEPGVGIEVTGEDIERGREVARAWMTWCALQGKEPWPR